MRICGTEYLGVVTDALETTSQGRQCTSAVREAAAELELRIAEPRCCQETEKLLRLCDRLDPFSQLDVANLFESLAGNFEGVVQYNKDNRISARGANVTIDVLCDVMTDESLGSPLARYAAINSMLLDVAGEKCLDFRYDKVTCALVCYARFLHESNYRRESSKDTEWISSDDKVHKR